MHEFNAELVEYFADYLKNYQQKSKARVSNIVHDCKAFLRFVEENYASEINKKNLLIYLDWLEENYSEASFITKASNLRQFTNWLNLEENPFTEIKITRDQNKFAYLSPEQIFQPWQSPHEFSLDYLLIRLMYELYLSYDEVIKLCVADFNQASRCFKTREVSIAVSDELFAQSKLYLKNYREELANSPYYRTTLEDPFFIKAGKNNHEPESLAAIDILETLKKYKLKNSILKRSRVMDLLNNQGLSFEQIEKQYNIKVSDFYSPHMKKQDYRLLNSYNQFHPRAQC